MLEIFCIDFFLGAITGCVFTLLFSDIYREIAEFNFGIWCVISNFFQKLETKKRNSSDDYTSNSSRLSIIEKKIKKCISDADYLFTSPSQKYMTMAQITQKSDKRKNLEQELMDFFKEHLVGMYVHDAVKFVKPHGYMVYTKFEAVFATSQSAREKYNSHECDSECLIFSETENIKKEFGASKKLKVKAQGPCKKSSIITEIMKL